MVIKEYLEEAIQLELNVSKLYLNFSNQHDEDYIFWYNLAIEEGGHASILKNIHGAVELVDYKFKVTVDNLNELKEANKYIFGLLSKTKYTRSETFKLAIDIESSAGEIHYQKILDSDIDDDILNIFIKLNEDDEYHLERIKDYANTHNINYE